jgi:shikimate kinase
MSGGADVRRGLALVGYRGTGKTTVGRILAERLHWKFADADHELEIRAGKSIAAIFAEEGETAFRDLESQVIADLATQAETVVATGGGAVLRAENREALRSIGFVAWLTADPDTLAKRLAREQNRPNARPALTPAGTLNEIAEVLAKRIPFYREVSDLEIDTVARSSHEVAQGILRAWSSGGRRDGL